MGHEKFVDEQLEAKPSRDIQENVDDIIPAGGALDLPRSLPQVPRYDRLTVFQAAPLVWKDNDDNLHTIEMLDFDRERGMLTESMREALTVGAEIELVFETATTDRLSAFLATSETQVLHFTCHGLPEYLAIEDGSGGAQFLRDDELREFMSAGNGELLFVFVSACYSRAAGEAFLEAGVPHVVCCQHDEPLMDLAALEFSRNFYLSLAYGNSLRRSFELAKQAVKLCPQIPNAQDEMRKFLLLPEDGDHDVPIFFTKDRQRSFGLKPSHPISDWILPPPPEVFVGREMEMYRIIQKLGPGKSRLVRMTGCPGSGKASLAAAVARYISIRDRTFTLFDEVIWLPLLYSTRIDKLSFCFHKLFAILQDESIDVVLQYSDSYRHVCGTIIEALYQSRALLVIETKALLELQSINKLSIFLRDLFRGTKYVRVLLVCQQGFEISLRNSVVESEVVVEPLDFETTATLFGRLCPFVSDHRCSRACTPRQLGNILVPKEKGGAKLFDQEISLSKRCVDIFRMVGGGVPSRVYLAAREMSSVEYDRLIEMGEQLEYNPDCKTRVDLEVQLARLQEDVQVAVRESKFRRAKEIQGALDELEMQREALPEVEQLRRMAADLKDDLENAVVQRNFSEAEKLSQQLDLVSKKIEVEEEALLLHDRDNKPSQDSESKKESNDSWLLTRAGLESEIRKLQNQLEDAVEKRDFQRCQKIQSQIDECAARRESLPCLEELSSMITALNAKLEVSIASKNFNEAETIHRNIQDLERKVALEKETEDTFVAATSILFGKRLLVLGETLQQAVENHEYPRAKELESAILSEIKGLDERFTLRYPPSKNPNDANNGSSTAGRNSGDQVGIEHAARAPGARFAPGPPKTKAFPSPPTYNIRTDATPPIGAHSSEPTTVAHIPSGNVSSTVRNESRPGAVAAPGTNESARRGSDSPSFSDADFLEAVCEPPLGCHREKDNHLASVQVQDRFDRGLCLTCPTNSANATQCYVFKSSSTDPRVRTRIPLSIDGLVLEGKCLICNPEVRLRRENPRRRYEGNATPIPVYSSRLPTEQIATPRRNSATSSLTDLDGLASMSQDNIAIATRVDAVAQEEAIERIVRNAIRREAVRADSDESSFEQPRQQERRKEKKSFLPDILKFGKKKKGNY